MLLVMLVIVSGCASIDKPGLSDNTAKSYSETDKSAIVKSKQAATVAKTTEETKHKGAELDQTEDEPTISPEALYYLLSGEIAGQRNRIKLSADSYVKSAKLTNSPKIAARAARIAMYAKDYKTAMDAAKVWTDNDPDNVSARHLVADLQLKRGKTGQAIDNFALILSSPDINFEKTAVRIADSIVSSTEKPYPVIDALLQRFPGTAELPFAYALIAIKLKDFGTAETYLDQTLTLRPDWDAALLMKTKLVAQSGKTEEAMTMLNQATRRFPDNAEIHALYAKLLAMQHDYSNAVVHFQRVVELDPENADAGFALAIMQSTLGDFDSAKERLLELAKNPKHRQRAFLQLGQLSAENKLYDEALDWLDQVDSSALAYDAHIFASEILVEQNDYQGALDQLRKLLNKYPQLTPRIALRQADIYNKIDQPEQAVEVLSNAVTSSPTDKQLLYMRALLADQIGDYPMAESDLRALLKIEPDNVNALNALGYILCNRTDRLDEAERFLNQAISLKPNDPAIMDSIGWLRYKQNNVKEALQFLQSAYQKNKDVEIGTHLAEVLWAGGQFTEANQVLQELWNKNSSHEALLKMKQRLPEVFEGVNTN
ncbi:MAG: tetratricopeptide repeat protein [Gammaproteobacteria bacterium]|nr:tetratricopeptide repeat protein [Gammaproteobacteria bacterium]